MIRLALDTSADRLSVAAAAADGRIAVREAAGARRHAALLGPLVLEALGDLGCTLADLGSLLLADGPGSFTGLRVGAAWAKGVALARGIPLAVASTLLVRAARVREDRPIDVAGVGSALRGELYVAGYCLTPDAVETRVAPMVIAPGQALPGGFVPEWVVGDVPVSALGAWPWARRATAIGPPDGYPDAVTLLRLAGLAGGAAVIANPASWEPVYGRPSEAVVRWERDHGRSLADSVGRVE